MRPTLRPFAGLFLRVGNLTFGGGDPTLAALQIELTDRKRWLTPEQFGLAYSLARITPGTNLLAFCAAAGWLVRGSAGALMAVLAVSVPSAVLAVWLLMAYQSWETNALVRAAMGSILAAVAAMMLASAVLLVQPRLKDAGVLRCGILTGGAALAQSMPGVSPLVILALAAMAGFFWKEPARR
ncbi:MAG: chromate transporter [Acidobacteriia bacterium]|nr:chromate transporter [Terriglobia bacterium]